MPGLHSFPTQTIASVLDERIQARNAHWPVLASGRPIASDKADEIESNLSLFEYRIAVSEIP